jgi:hypothetical protein
MKKVFLILGLSVLAWSCTIESTVIKNNNTYYYYYNGKPITKDSLNALLKAEPWISKDSIDSIGKKKP